MLKVVDDVTQPLDRDDLRRMVFTLDANCAMNITPEVAEWLMELNRGNDPLVVSYAMKLAAEMKGGWWGDWGYPIIVSRKGILNDGQHRLCAVILSGRTLRMRIAFGASQATARLPRGMPQQHPRGCNHPRDLLWLSRNPWRAMAS